MDNQELPEKSKTVLYLSRSYLPSTNAAGIRAGRCVEGFLKHGYYVCVVSGSEKAGWERPTPELEICRVGPNGELPKQVREDRTAAGWPWWKPMPGPDPDRNCTGALFRAAQVMIRQNKPDLIYVMGPPFSLLVVARQLSLKYQLPFIAELDDAWYTGMPWPYRNFLQRNLAQKWEQRCLSEAAGIVTVTRTHQKILAEKYLDEVAAKISTIPHSFDRGQTKSSKPTEPDKSKTHNKEKFTLAYVGQVHGIDVTSSSPLKKILQGLNQRGRRILLGANFCEKLRLDWMSPYHLLAATAQAARQDDEFSQGVQINFVGTKYPQIDNWARKMNLGHMVSQQGPRLPEQAARFVEQADLLLVNLYGIVGMDYHWCVPTKTYTYLGSGKPILALLPPGEAADIIRRAGTGFFAPPAEVNSISELLLKLFHQHKSGAILVKPNWEYINQFDLENQQQHFAQVVRNVLKEKNKEV